MGHHLFLTGFRGTGKTSVARILAERLSRPLVDLDERVERSVGQTIAEIFDSGGEERFRELEAAALATVMKEPSSVVALGGGVILRESNRRLIRSHGFCVWLDASPETLAARIAADTATATQRPPLTAFSAADEVREILERRRPLYQAASDQRVETTSKTVEQVADEVMAVIWQQFPPSEPSSSSG